MSNKKQSSVEWLIENAENFCGNLLAPSIIEKAKAMHKEEIKEAYDAVIIDENVELLDGKEYYNETFGGNNEK